MNFQFEPKLTCLGYFIKKIILFFKLFFYAIAEITIKTFYYRQYDSSTYWRNRAFEEGQKAVLWTNEEYNNLVREEQYRIIEPYVKNLKPNSSVLDIGCGIGVVSHVMLKMNPNIVVDAVDFEEMIQRAKKEHPDKRINYIASAAENYFDPTKSYELIISLACFSMIRDLEKMKNAMSNCARMCKPDGIILMIDPFHRWNYLARAKISSNDVVRFMNRHGFKLIYKSGILFWPYRVMLANSNLKGEPLRRKFRQGELLLKILGIHLWADYKVLIFRKEERG